MLSQQLTPEVSTQSLEKTPVQALGYRKSNETQMNSISKSRERLYVISIISLPEFQHFLEVPHEHRMTAWGHGSSMYAHSKPCGHCNSPWWEVRQMHICSCLKQLRSSLPCCVYIDSNSSFKKSLFTSIWKDHTLSPYKELFLGPLFPLLFVLCTCRWKGGLELWLSGASKAEIQGSDYITFSEFRSSLCKCSFKNKLAHTFFLLNLTSHLNIWKVHWQVFFIVKHFGKQDHIQSYYTIIPCWTYWTPYKIVLITPQPQSTCTRTTWLGSTYF